MYVDDPDAKRFLISPMKPVESFADGMELFKQWDIVLVEQDDEVSLKFLEQLVREGQLSFVLSETIRGCLEFYPIDIQLDFGDDPSVLDCILKEMEREEIEQWESECGL